MTTLPEWLVERAALEEVPAASRHRLESADPGELAAHIARLRQENAAELSAHPPGPAVAQIEQAAARARTERARQRRGHRALFAAAGAAAALVVVVALRRGELTGQAPVATADRPAAGSDPERETTRIKGDARLMAFRKAGDRVERLAPGAAVQAGDVLQLRYNGGGRRYGVIASIDGAGAVTLHFPDSEGAPTALAEKTSDLPHAYALDDAPRFERFFFITADQPIDVARTLADLRAFAARPGSERASPELPPRHRLVSLLLTKARRP